MDSVRLWLESNNLNMEILLTIMAVLFVVFILTTRELVAWFCKSNQIRKDIGKLNYQLEKLQTRMQNLELYLIESPHITSQKEKDSFLNH